MPDVIVDGVTGRMSPLGDIPGMGKAILSLIADTDGLKAMQQRCRDVTVERFALSVQAKRYADQYSELVRESVASPSCCLERGDDLSRRFSVIETDTLAVPVVARVGQNTKAILDPMLLKGLKRFALMLQKKLKGCEADRDEGFKAVHAYQEQLKEMRFQLKMSEEDRAARLTCIREHETQRERILNELKSSEAEKGKILADRDHCQEELQRLQQKIHTSIADTEALQHAIRLREKELAACNERLEEIRASLEANERERQTRLLSIEHYHRQLSDMFEDLQTWEVDRPFLMETLDHSQRHFHEIGRLLNESERDRCSGLNRSPMDLYYTALNRTYLSALHALKLLGYENGRRECLSIHAINSHLVETFVNSRSQKGDLDDGALAFLYDMGQTLRKVICIAPSCLNIQALYVLKQTGVDVSCFSGNGPHADLLKSFGIAQIPEDLASWLVKGGQTAFVGWDGIMMDAEMDEDALRLLKGRLWPKNRIIITGVGPKSKSCSGICNAQGEMIFGLKILDRPPADWLDPFYRSRSLYLQMAWPWKEGAVQFPSTLPSGRPWPRISIVTATRNQGDWLEETLRSVLMQQYPNLEYIVIDGASTDTTPAVLERYRGQLTHCISEKDKGQSDALNKGFGLATGDILAWLNSDDRYLPWTLMRAALAFDIYDADMVAGGCALVKEGENEAFRVHHTALAVGQRIPLPLERLLDIDGSWQKGDFFFQPEIFWTRRIWEISGGSVDEDLFYSMDYELWVRMAQQGATIVHVPDTLALFRIHEKQKTNGVDLPFLNELRQVNAVLKARAT
jgi:GT2 family glycosyltransferase